MNRNPIFDRQVNGMHSSEFIFQDSANTDYETAACRNFISYPVKNSCMPSLFLQASRSWDNDPCSS